MTGLIYAIFHDQTGRCYVGQTKKSLAERWRRHVSFATVGDGQTYLARAIRKYGIGSFIPVELERVPVDQIDRKERDWIKKLGAFGQKTGFNMTHGGDVNPMAIESLRKKVSKALKGRARPAIRGDNHCMRRNPDLARKISEALKGKYVGEKASAWGRKPSPEHIAKLRALNTGRIVSDGTRAKLSAAAAGTPWSDERRAAIMAGRAKSEKIAANNRRLGDETRARQTGKPITELHRTAIRASNAKRVVSEETRIKMAEKRSAYWASISPEERIARAKIGGAAAKAANTGRPLSDERKAKISAAKRKRLAP